MDLRLDGRTALVTGGSRGIGQAIAAAFAAAGASVMISSRKAEALARTATEIAAADGGRGRRGRLAGGQRRRPRAGRGVRGGHRRALRMRWTSWSTTPPPIPTSVRSWSIDTARADKTVRVNQSGYLEWVQAAWRAGMAEQGGAVLNLASVGGLSVEGGIGWYNVTKAAVIHLTSQLAGELGPGVRVNALAPGLVKTEFARALWEPGGGGHRPSAAPPPAGGRRRHRRRRAVPVLGRRLVDHRAHPGGRRGRPVHRQRRDHLRPSPNPGGAAAPQGQARAARRRLARGPGQGADHHQLTGAAQGASCDGRQLAQLAERRRCRGVLGHHPGHHPLDPTRGRAASTPPPGPPRDGRRAPARPAPARPSRPR